ncbi:ribonuclease E activity regulator RraA [Aeromicrobium erythreum]|uniref:4-hydroxy-4-methyl-2-oxoglutarate aldolase n=1 Tax=Aeromicrobium erythreum TaxID=2041 RepID=A0A0U3SY34_9ACTN|nr:ribonuclease E activity regulator RraA [Aeromicrobium erythreum]ALX03432.1 ribonuclease activity regulator protein RraA [Aeromicrobium erythreum]
MTGWTTPDLCDDHFPDRVSVVQPGLLRGFGGREAFAGPVETVSCFEDNSRVKELVVQPGEGRVLVVDGGGSLRRALLGDLIAARYVENGWAGLVIHGAVRDAEVLRDLDLGVQALAPTPVRTERRGLGDVGVEVTFGGVTVRPGQWVYADATGVLVAEGRLDAV